MQFFLFFETSSFLGKLLSFINRFYWKRIKNKGSMISCSLLWWYDANTYQLMSSKGRLGTLVLHRYNQYFHQQLKKYGISIVHWLSWVYINGWWHRFGFVVYVRLFTFLLHQRGQLSFRNTYFYRFLCHHPLITQFIALICE